MKKYYVSNLFLLALATFLGVCQVAGQDSTKRPSVSEALFLKGERLYQKQCVSCHGAQGTGDGSAAYLLYPKPRDFTRGEFRLISTTTMEATDEDLFKTITRGMSGSAMPPWDFLPEEDRWGLVYYVRYLAELGKARKAGTFSDEAIQKGIPWETRKKLMTKEISPDAVIQVSNESPVTSESLTRGRELFVKACAPCHGREGRGDGQKRMEDSLGFPLKPRDLTSGFFKGSSASEDMYDRMVAGIPGTPMPSYQGAFSDEQIWDLIHYVQTLSKPQIEERVRLRRNVLVAQKMKGKLPMEPLQEDWMRVEPVSIALTPLWWRDERIERIDVRILYNEETIAFHLSWHDSTRDSATLAPQSFSDGVALQFSMENDPPFFAMGSKGHSVFIWHWKASWQEDQLEWVDIETRYPNMATDGYQFHDPRFMAGWGAGNPLSDPERKSSAEEGVAQGFGSFTTQISSSEKVHAKGIWHDGQWEVVFVRSLKTKDSAGVQFKPGGTIPIAFAVWDGSQQDRNGQKMISIWNELRI